MQPDGFADIDTKTASAARMYDYMLGGRDNYAVDRIAVNRVEDLLPGTNAMVRNNRRFLERVVRYLAQECGIRQFIDNGSGLPTRDNVHDIAQRLAAGARVIYVDNDPVVLRHQQVQALAGNANTAFILADARDVDAILAHPETRRLLDFAASAAVLYFAFLHFIPDEDDPGQIIRRMIDRLAPGSYLALSHTVSDQPEIRQLGTELARDNTKGRFGRIREVREVRAFFDGLELLEPGLVDIRDWHPDGRDEKQTDRWFLVGGVGRKPG
jgi:SAM-dependent methyltransferase